MLKTIKKKILAHINIHKFSNEYWSTIKELSFDIKKEDTIKLNSLLLKSIKEVPFYEKLSLKEIDIKNFPIIDKQTILDNEKEFINKNIKSTYLKKYSTGGTTGISLNLYKERKEFIRETAYIDFLVKKIVRKKIFSPKVGILRAMKPKSGIFEKIGKKVILNAGELSYETIILYVEIIEKEKIDYLHVFPSAIKLFCKYLELKNIKDRMPYLKGVLSSSEILTIEDKINIKKILGESKKIIDLYGHTEHLVMGYSEDFSEYKFFKNYGYLELRETNERIKNNKICEIIATGYNNEVMPLIRYSTNDFVEVNEKNQIVSIIGRGQDFVINKEKVVVPCILDTREETLKNVINFQFEQKILGEIIFNIVIGDNFQNKDELLILEDFNSSFGNKFTYIVKKVDKIPKTNRGKQKRLIQHLNLQEYF